MAVLTIRTSPDPVLRKRTKKVRKIDGSIRKLVADMRETLHADPGRVGLSANQVGYSLRVTVIGIPEQEDIILINPEIIRREGRRLVTEGCLSIPGYIGELYRSETVTVKGLGLDGKEIHLKAEGLLAQALEHETDHLDGKLYIDHMDGTDTLRKIEPENTGTVI